MGFYLLEFLTKNQMLNVVFKKKNRKREKRFPWRPSVLPLLRRMKKRKPFFLSLITTESQSPGGLSQNQRRIWIESSVVFGTDEDGLHPKTRGNTENHQILKIVDVLYVKQQLQLQFHINNDPSPGLVKAIELFDLVAARVLKRLRTGTKIFLKPSFLPHTQVVLVEKQK